MNVAPKVTIAKAEYSAESVINIKIQMFNIVTEKCSFVQTM